MRLFFFFAFFSLYSSILQGQTLFEIECNLPGIKNKTGKALIYCDKYGDGFMRLNWYDAEKKERVIKDLELLPSYRRTIPGYFTKYSIIEKDTFYFNRAVLTKDIRGSAKFPSEDFIFWLHKGDSTNNRLKPYTGKMPQFEKGKWQNKYYEFNELYKMFYDYGIEFPPLLGFQDSIRIINSRELTPKQLTKELLSLYFINSELIYRYPLSIEQLLVMRNKINATLYCITVTDILDPKISETTLIDKRTIQSFFSDAANGINLKIRHISIEGNDYNLSKLNAVIKTLPVTSNDIVVFAFSGHGFSYSNDAVFQYPQLALWQGPQNAASFRSKSVNLETIFYKIREKGARLTIVMGDCCNTDAGIPRTIDKPPRVEAMIGPIPPNLRRNYLRLLLESKGAFIACAAKKGEPATGDIYKGGFFTSNFESILRRRLISELEIDPATIWSTIFSQTSNAASRDASRLYCKELNGTCRQTAVFKKVSIKNIVVKRRK